MNLSRTATAKMLDLAHLANLPSGNDGELVAAFDSHLQVSLGNGGIDAVPDERASSAQITKSQALEKRVQLFQSETRRYVQLSPSTCIPAAS